MGRRGWALSLIKTNINLFEFSTRGKKRMLFFSPPKLFVFAAVGVCVEPTRSSNSNMDAQRKLLEELMGTSNKGVTVCVSF